MCIRDRQSTLGAREVARQMAQLQRRVEEERKQLAARLTVAEARAEKKGRESEKLKLALKTTKREQSRLVRILGMFEAAAANQVAADELSELAVDPMSPSLTHVSTLPRDSMGSGAASVATACTASGNLSEYASWSEVSAAYPPAQEQQGATPFALGIAPRMRTVKAPMLPVVGPAAEPHGHLLPTSNMTDCVDEADGQHQHLMMT